MIAFKTSQIQNSSALIPNNKEHFPIFSKTFLNDKPLVYLDTGATAQQPSPVIQAAKKFAEEEYATVRRGMYRLSLSATQKYEKLRSRIASFLNISDARQIIFTYGATFGINLVAQCSKQFISPGDEILISEMEHHSNWIPWQQICQEKNATLRIIPITDEGELDLDKFFQMLNEKTKFIAITHVSNVLGTINPVDIIIKAGHDFGAKVLVDGAQATGHFPVDLKKLNPDFYVFSTHKMYGPTGLGILFGKYDILQTMPPFVTGGEMIQEVSKDSTLFLNPPYRFEAGTAPFQQAMAFEATLNYIEHIGLENIAKQDAELLAFTDQLLSSVPGITTYGPKNSKQRSSILSFNLKNIHPHDVNTFLDQDNICIRSGQMCATPLMKRFGVVAMNRISLGIYNTKSDIEILLNSLIKTENFFGSK